MLCTSWVSVFEEIKPDISAGSRIRHRTERERESGCLVLQRRASGSDHAIILKGSNLFRQGSGTGET